MIFSVDTNVLFYTIDRLSAEKRAMATMVMQRMRELDCVLTTQVLGEFLAAVRRKNKAAFSDATVLVEGWSRTSAVANTTPADLLNAAILADRYKLQFWDSLILAVARSADVSVMLTEDMQDGATIDGVRLLNPFNPANRAALDALLAP